MGHLGDIFICLLDFLIFVVNTLGSHDNDHCRTVIRVIRQYNVVIYDYHGADCGVMCFHIIISVSQVLSKFYEVVVV